MENRIITAVFKGSKNTKVSDVWQWDYGQTLRIQGLDLPTAVEVDFAVAGASESIARIGTTKDGVTDVVIPDSLIETGKNLVAYIYLRDSASGNTEYQIDMLVTKRAKPEAYDRPEDKKLFGQAIEAVNTAADRAEKAGQAATEAAGQAAEDAQQTAEDRKEVAKMVETVSDISEQVKKVEQLSQQAQEAATKTEADAQQTAEDRVEVGKMLETVKDVSEQVKSVEESVQKAKESEQAAAGHRTAVEEMKNSVEQTASTFPQKVQEGVQAIENAGTAEVQEITQAGTAQKTAVEGAGTQAVESVENVKASATEAVETAKTEAVQAVQTEGVKQIKEVQDKGAEVLQSIPEDFATQMETKLNKQQGIENKGKVLVIGEDGNVVPGEVQSGGGDGIAIINTMSGESPLVIPDSAERVNKGLELGGKTEQVQTTGKNLIYYRNAVAGLLNFTDGSFSGTYHKYFTTDFIEIEIGDYIISHNSNAGIQSYALYDINDKTYISGKAATNKVNTLNKCFIRISFSTKPETDVSSDPVSYARKCNIQIEKGTSATPYEPYTGGKPSPSPEYLQEIKNVGKWNDEKQKYEVDVKVFAGNLFDGSNSKKGFFTGEFGGQISLITSQGYSWESKIDTLSGVKVTLSVQSNINTRFRIYATDINGMILYKYEDSSANQADNYHTFVIPDKTENLLVSVLEISDSKDAKIILNVGENRLPNAIYKAPQSLTLTSDRPLTKWDRLVEQGGQIGWLYAGVVIDRFDGQSNKISIANKQGDVQNFSIRFENVANGNGNSDIFVDKYRAVQLSYTKAEYGICCNWNDGVKYFSAPNENVATVDEFKAWLAENPLKIVYETTNPEFVPLPQSEQNAIRALKTYYPTTVITNDQGCVMELDYVADTKLYIDNKVSAKVASIISQYQLNTANLLSLMPMETQATMIENDTNNILNNLESEEAHE